MSIPSQGIATITRWESSKVPEILKAIPAGARPPCRITLVAKVKERKLRVHTQEECGQLGFFRMRKSSNLTKGTPKSNPAGGNDKSFQYCCQGNPQRSCWRRMGIVTSRSGVP